MAKLATAYVQIVPKMSEESVREIVRQVTDAVAEGVRRGLAAETTELRHVPNGEAI